jgi:hypothetical protein
VEVHKKAGTPEIELLIQTVTVLARRAHSQPHCRTASPKSGPRAWMAACLPRESRRCDFTLHTAINPADLIAAPVQAQKTVQAKPKSRHSIWWTTPSCRGCFRVARYSPRTSKSGNLS